jgi:hypothetical protein
LSSSANADLPVWHETSGRYLDVTIGEPLPEWDDALDAKRPRKPVRDREQIWTAGQLRTSSTWPRAIGCSPSTIWPPTPVLAEGSCSTCAGTTSI